MKKLRPRWWRWTSLSAFLAGLAALLWFLAGRSDEVIERADSLSSVGSLAVGIASLGLSGVALVLSMRPQPNAGDDQSELAAASAWLAGEVRKQWNDEAAVRQLRQPRPLRLHWSATNRSLTSATAVALTNGTSAEKSEPGPDIAGELVRLHSVGQPARDLVTAFRGLPSRQLVIIGGPGAGKSVLAMLFTLAALDPRPDDEPVPVLLNAATWNPREPLRSWMARRIAEEYPGLTNEILFGGNAPARLGDDNRVMPMLDGIDEIPAGLHAQAMSRIDETTGTGMQVVLTCRSDEYATAVMNAGPLSRAAVVEIRPIDVEDAIRFLTEAELSGSDRWRPVAELMRANHNGVLASALSNPLMIALARLAYRAPRTDPRALAGLTEAEKVEAHLLDRFLPTVYGPETARLHPYPSKRAEQWLTVLAYHLQGRQPSIAADEAPARTDLAWWHLAQMVPRYVMTFLVTAAITVAGVVSSVAQALVTDSDVGRAVQIGASLALPLGLIAGLSAARSASGATRRTGLLALIGAALRDSLTGAVAFVVMVAFTGKRRFSPDWPYAEHLIQVLLAGMVAGTVVGIICNGLRQSRAASPHRPSLNLRQLPLRLLTSMGVGLLFGLATGLVVGILVAIEEWSFRAGALATLLTATALTVALGIPIGLGRWLGSPIDEQSAPSPASTVRSDRRSLLAVVIATTVPISLVAAVVTLLMDASAGDALTAGLFVSLTFAVVVLFGSGAPWLTYTVARVWLAWWGRMPWRPLRFLEDAHLRGVLRRAGAMYQFRHALLQRHLAQRHSSNRGGPLARLFIEARAGRGESRWARWRAIAGTSIAVLLLLGVLAVATIPSLRESAQTRLASAAAEHLLLQADHMERSHPDTALRLRIAAEQIAAPERRKRIPLETYARMRSANAGIASSTATWCWCHRVARHGLLGAYDEDDGTLIMVSDAGPARRVSIGHDVQNFELSPHGDKAIVSGSDRQAVLLDLTTTPPRRDNLGLLSSTALDATFSANGRWVLVQTGPTRGIELWNLTGKPPRRIDLNGQATTGEYEIDMEFSPAGRWAVLPHEKGRTVLRNLATTDARPVILGRSAGRVGMVQFNELEDRAIIVQPDGKAAAWDLATTPVRSISLGTGAAQGVISPDGHRAIVVSAGGKAVLWDLTVSPPQATPLDVRAKQVQISPAGEHALVWYRDNTLRLWDLSATPMKSSASYTGATGAYFSPNGTYVVLRRGDGGVEVARVRDRSLEPLWSSGFGNGLGFSSDGRWMFSASRGSGDGLLWFLNGPEAVQVATFNQQNVVTFGQDGKTVLTGDSRIVVSWSLDELVGRRLEMAAPGDAHSFACRIAGRGLDKAEWARYVPRVWFWPTLSYRSTC